MTPKCHLLDFIPRPSDGWMSANVGLVAIQEEGGYECMCTCMRVYMCGGVHACVCVYEFL